MFSSISIPSTYSSCFNFHFFLSSLLLNSMVSLSPNTAVLLSLLGKWLPNDVYRNSIPLSSLICDVDGRSGLVGRDGHSSTCITSAPFGYSSTMLLNSRLAPSFLTRQTLAFSFFFMTFTFLFFKTAMELSFDAKLDEYFAFKLIILSLDAFPVVCCCSRW
eukprot:NODE_31_length_32452_cov_0.352672.p21 type:complete len:161 gc:universal NODE_31_length_32452_cov_0.352672:9654-9172(-)